MTALRTLAIFLAAALCEIGGGYLVWLGVRGGKGAVWAVAGGAALFLYGLLLTAHPAQFGRVYAAYGGVFIAASVAWGWGVDGAAPDRFDVLGALIALAGAGVILFAPRA